MHDLTSRTGVRRLRPPNLRMGVSRWLTRDVVLFYTASLAPVVILVAVARRQPLETVAALALSALALTVQWALPRLARRTGRRHLAHPLVRLGVVMAYVSAATFLVAGAPYPLLTLFVPVVAGAAAIGTAEAVFVGAATVIIYLVPVISHLDRGTAIGERGLALAGCAAIVAFGTRRVVVALQSATKQARVAVVAERRRARQIAGLESVGVALASGGPTPDLLDRAVAVVAERFRYDSVSVHLLEGGHLRLGAQRGYGRSIEAFDGTLGLLGRALTSGRVILVPDVSVDADYLEVDARTVSEIVAPLVADGRVIGVLNIESQGRRLDRADRDVVGVVAGRMASAIALGQERQGLDARVRLMQTLHALGDEIGGTLVPEALHQAIVARVGEVVPADLVALVVLDRADGSYRVAHTSGAPEAVGVEVRPGEGLAGRAIRDRATVIDDRFSRAQYAAGIRDLPAPEILHGVGLPLVRQGVVVGAVSVGRRAAGVPFTALELEALQLIGDQAGLAIANSFLHAELTELAVRDPLTGLFNRRHFDAMLERMLATHHRHRNATYRPIAAIVFDLDNFGSFNKLHGHQVGDEVLKTFAEILRTRFRRTDLVARMGGEEFVAIMDGASREQAVALADEVRGALAAATIAVDGDEIHVTVSAGCAQVDESEPTREALLRTADVALFMAKRGGRDRVVAA
ncbi:MAG: diguanylate cyclase [Chloroflexota bacterium]